MELKSKCMASETVTKPTIDYYSLLQSLESSKQTPDGKRPRAIMSSILSYSMKVAQERASLSKKTKKFSVPLPL